MVTKKTAFVTGAEGFIGSHLLRFLQAKGWQTIGSYRLHGHNSFPKADNMHFVHCDLRNGQRVTQLLIEYEPTHVFHLGAQSLPTLSWEDPVDTFESNIMGSLHLFEAVRRMKRPPVVEILRRRAEQKQRTIEQRLRYNLGRWNLKLKGELDAQV